MRKPLGCLIPLVLLLAGCSHWIGAQSRAAADRSVTFAQLRENSDAYRGRLVLLGGVVAAAAPAGEGTRLEVVEHRLNAHEFPDEGGPSGGRFLATASGRLDPARYKAGALVSMMGEVVGKEVRPLEGVAYVYPVIAVREIHAIERAEVLPDLFHLW